jgi:hypothetical protein
MHVLISWSGDRSRAVAETLRKWLPYVLQHLRPWMSGHDIKAGADWSAELRKGLAKTDVGIVCVTPENLESKWMLFEAGALAKSVEHGHVIPVLLGLEPTDITDPLAQFQSVKLSRDGIHRLVKSLNEYSPRLKVVFPEILEGTVEAFWPQLDKAIQAIPPPEAADGSSPHRTDRELLEEIVRLARLFPGTEGRAEPATIEEMVEVLQARLRVLDQRAEAYSIAEYGVERSGHDVPEGLRRGLKEMYEQIPMYESAIKSLEAILKWGREQTG